MADVPTDPIKPGEAAEIPINANVGEEPVSPQPPAVENQPPVSQPPPSQPTALEAEPTPPEPALPPEPATPAPPVTPPPTPPAQAEDVAVPPVEKFPPADIAPQPPAPPEHELTSEEMGPPWLRTDPNVRSIQDMGTAAGPPNLNPNPSKPETPMPWQVPSEKAGLDPAVAAEEHKGGFPVIVFVILIVLIILAILAYLFVQGSLPFISH